MHRLVLYSILTSAFLCPLMHAKPSPKNREGWGRIERIRKAQDFFRMQETVNAVIDSIDALAQKAMALTLSHANLAELSKEELLSTKIALLEAANVLLQLDNYKTRDQIEIPRQENHDSARNMKLAAKIMDGFIRVLRMPEFQAEVNKVVDAIAKAVDTMPMRRLAPSASDNIARIYEKIISRAGSVKSNNNLGQAICEYAHDALIKLVNTYENNYLVRNEQTGTMEPFVRISSTEQPRGLSQESQQAIKDIERFIHVALPYMYAAANEESENQAWVTELSTARSKFIEIIQATGMKRALELIDAAVKRCDTAACMKEMLTTYNVVNPLDRTK